ncbi:MAG: EamA family transporter [Deltaproteobacteria bacterium]|nr:EamA family transporter [Deltaproteobacteria bacterium]
MLPDPVFKSGWGDSEGEIPFVFQTSSKNARPIHGFLPYLLLLVPPLCWGGNAVVARGVADVVPPVSLAFWRWTLAFFILMPFTLGHVKRDWRTAMQSWQWMLILSCLGISCFNVLLYTAAHTTTAINMSLMQTVMPATIILISWVVFREKISSTQMVGVVVSMAGAFILVVHGQWRVLLTMELVEGDVLMLIAVFIYALYSALFRKRPSIHPLSMLALTFGLGALMLLPLYIWELVRVGPFSLSVAAVMSILYVAVFPSIVAYFCWNRGIELIGANRAGLFTYLVPVFASVLAIAFLGETLHLYHFMGMILIIGGMVIFNRRG